MNSRISQVMAHFLKVALLPFQVIGSYIMGKEEAKKRKKGKEKRGKRDPTLTM